MNIRKRWKNRGIMIEEWPGKGEEFRKHWEQVFADAISPQEKQSIYFDQFLWHIFSYEKLPCLEGKEAMRAFREMNRVICYLFYQEREETYMLINAENLRAEGLRNEHDVCVVDPHFMWTHVQTHEDYCGPYFYRKE
ncbi:DUF4275 family protein [Parageobacillus thermoglucosidasius]|uniref:DUF4275 family protein n=1 Tax=Parageobacillus thermoglucosidasius TaxID=1426 RepID=UPI000B579338|nr:DUF4275 family protein [Parageobacillus thermoglucosidasius]MBY6270060.1 DUF4275 domain-containing protein [Parageobacillus thermoglucosidasius]OUM88272.1 MAG: hypothetical protein BAA00_19030 [Parageobacillus thermoglucosidasius]